MNAKKLLRIIALAMLAAALVFVYIAISAPTLGRVFYIGSFMVDAYVMRLFYKSYAAVMAGLFVLSFLVGNGKKF